MKRVSFCVVLALSGVVSSQPAPPLFTLLTPEETGVTFRNALTETPVFNRLNYEYFYNGGGVGVGDINNDNLPDLYFTGNQVGDQLYLNQGNLKFKDITKTAGIKQGGWHTGVSMIDINTDGWLDIYVCRSGMESPTSRKNFLYINNKNSTFTERAAEYGLADTGHSVQAAFFDYDRDGDLDMYLLNHPVKHSDKAEQDYYAFRAEGHHESDRLYRNDAGRFTDVTKEAGLFDYAFRHGIAIGDVNQDGWPDIYVCADFTESDRLYINKNGKFENQILQLTKHISNFSMGVDMADFNNDGLLDIFVVDMTPEGHVRSKTNMAAMSIPQFWSTVKMGFHHQYMVNTLQLNNGSGFSEIGQLAGVARTDWSWAPLFADFDNDGFKDLFITNGIRRDVLDNDALQKMRERSATNKPIPLEEALSFMPMNVVPNYAYRNKGNLQFESVADSWGLGKPENSNGAVYSDLDRDGDLDLVTNTMEDVAHIYRNTMDDPLKTSLRIRLVGPPSNPLGIGARITVTGWESAPDNQLVAKRQYQEVYLTRGYLSSVEPVMHFGLNGLGVADVAVEWPDGTANDLFKVFAGEIVVKHSDAKLRMRLTPTLSTLVADITSDMGLTLRYHENPFDDFARELLIPHKQSENGPQLAIGDANGDRLTDFYFPGAKSIDGQLLLQRGDGFFAPSSQRALINDKEYEDAGSLFFDADGDGDEDLYIVSGGNEEPDGSMLYQDRLYINDGTGNYTRDSIGLPRITSSGSIVRAADIDRDGDLDIFRGGRVVPGRYPEAPRSYLLLNNNGHFSDAGQLRAPGLSKMGMVTDATFSDYDRDGDPDLLVVGEWMPFVIFRNDITHMVRVEPHGIDCSTGWWFNITASDLDNDGDEDYVLGNLGHNNKFHPSPEHPLRIYGNDFDRNGSFDIVLAKASDNSYVPVRGRECSSQQMPFIKQEFPTYKSFAEASIDQIYEDGIDSAIVLNACDLSSVIMWNEGGGRFRREELPIEAQFAPLRGIVVTDINHDGTKDIIAAGNMHGAEIETVRYDAGTGIILLNTAKGWVSRTSRVSGFYAPGDVRDMELISFGMQPVILVANNRGMLQAFVIRQ